ncbi:MAG: hypothetical protein H0V44_16755 [Planctomycetes bacterium]|nr:hypothetical protein [Planctomycetota bacterium]
MRHQTSSTASIHPSIDGLVALIQANKAKATSEEAAQLRMLCQRKITSYREDIYLKRYTTTPEQDAARTRWQMVTEFANRRPAATPPAKGR